MQAQRVGHLQQMSLDVQYRLHTNRGTHLGGMGPHSVAQQLVMMLL